MRTTPAGLAFEEVVDGQFERLLGEMMQYSDEDRGKLPRYILKRRSGKLFLYTAKVAIEQWTLLVRQREDFVLQPYIVSAGHRTKMVRVTWTQFVGSKAKLFINDHEFLHASEETSPKASPKSLEVDERYLCTTPFAQETDCVISQTTAHLAATIDYVRLILEQTVLQTFNCRINSLSVDVVPDLRQKWYFLCIDSYQLGVLKKVSSASALGTAKSATPSAVRSRLLSRRSERNNLDLPADLSATVESNHASAATSRASSSRLPFRGLRLQRKSELVKAKLADQMTGLVRTATEDSVVKRGLAARWGKTLALEDAISEMIHQKALRPISHITYRKWRERTDNEPHLSNIDLLYAQKLAAKGEDSRLESEAKLKDLVALKNEMMKVTAVGALGPDTVNQLVGKVLLERVQEAHDMAGPFFLSKVGSKARGGHPNTAHRLQQFRTERAKETLAQVSRRLDEMQRVARSRHQL